MKKCPRCGYIDGEKEMALYIDGSKKAHSAETRIKSKVVFYLVKLFMRRPDLILLKRNKATISCPTEISIEKFDDKDIVTFSGKNINESISLHRVDHYLDEKKTNHKVE